MGEDGSSEISLSHITSNLWIGNIAAAIAKNAEFGLVVNCQHRSYKCIPWTFWLEVPRKTDAKWKFSKFQRDMHHLCWQLQQYKDQKVLIHCRAGKHRAAAVTALVLVHMLGYCLADAKSLVEQARACVEFWRVDYLLNLQ